MCSYLSAIGIGLAPAFYHIYRSRQDYNKAIDIPEDDLLVQKVLGKNHGCRWNITNDGSDAGTTGLILFGYPLYPLLHMSREDFTTEAVKAHELCHIKNSDAITRNLVLGMVGSGTWIMLKQLIRPSPNAIVYNLAKNILILMIVKIAVGIIMPAYKRYIEKRADLEGFSFCSKEEQINCIQCFKDDQERSKDIRKCAVAWVEQHEVEQHEKGSQLVSEEIYEGLKEDIRSHSENGDFLKNPKHPLRSQRIAYLEQAYRDLYGENPPQPLGI